MPNVQVIEQPMGLEDLSLAAWQKLNHAAIDVAEARELMRNTATNYDKRLGELLDQIHDMRQEMRDLATGKKL